ncbi:response regulator [Zhaonella formicivorans]|uniref:response regulator n=1 Tax=Zhaonella formicivorans TaxID=2528593 RepID=UPI001D12F6C7|nr:response regulator [Zhaonella formicivorans]
MKPLPTALVVEDNPLNLELLEEVLCSQGYHVLKAENAEEAEEMLQDSLPDVIFLDIQLPGIDGITFARKLRAEKGRALPPLIAVTAHAMQGDAEKIMGAGFDYYLPKPVNINNFLQLLNSLGGKNEPAG